MDKKNKKGLPSKKDIKATLASQLHGLLADFKEAIHEKKLQKLVKKAARLLADGLHHNKTTPTVVSKKAKAKKAVPAKKTVPVKKAAAKKPAKKK
jgi:hypothetical protein